MLFRNIRFLSLVSALLMVTFYGVQATIPHTQVGLIESTKGQVWGSAPWRDKDAKANKQKGDTVVQDEVIATGYNAKTTITFIDKTILKLGENAKITIDEMVYDPANNENDKVVLRLGQGAFYFVSGKVAKQKVTLITPTATIGIRGTELLISVKANGATTVAVTSGRAFMQSRNNRGSNEISTGRTGHSDKDGNVSDARDGVDLTGDEDVDRNVEGMSDWQDEKEKEKDIAEFSDEDSGLGVTFIDSSESSTAVTQDNNNDALPHGATQELNTLLGEFSDTDDAVLDHSDGHPRRVVVPINDPPEHVRRRDVHSQRRHEPNNDAPQRFIFFGHG